MRNQKLSKKYEGSIELLENHFIFRYQCEADEPKEKDDHLAGWEPIVSDYERVCSKSSITGMDLEFQDTPERNSEIDADKWQISIYRMGVNGDVGIYYRKESDAKATYQKIKDWWMK